AGQHHFGIAVADKALDLIHHRAHRHGTGIAATIGNDAEGAAMIAAILHLHKGTRAAFNGIDHMACGFTHFHSVVDAHLFELVDAEIRQHPVGIGFQLFLIAENEVHFLHGGKIVGFGLRGAAGDDNARFRVFAASLADRLTLLAHGFRRHRTGIEDDRAILQFAETGGIGLALHHLGFIGVEAASESYDFHRHQAAPLSVGLSIGSSVWASRLHSPAAGSNVPENSHSAGPVIMT